MGKKADRFRALGLEITHNVIHKNFLYGDAVNKVAAKLAIDYPNGISPSQYEDMLIYVRMQDKLTRIANAEKTSGFETESPWIDMGGYSIIAAEQKACEDFVGLPPGKYNIRSPHEEEVKNDE